MTARQPHPDSKSNELPIATDCRGCGVCCLHMAYPAFMLTDQAAKRHDSPERFAPDADPDADSESLTDDQYWSRLPTELRIELENAIESYDESNRDENGLDGPCIWLDHETMLCRHHEHRPRVCRDFDIGSKICREWREHYRDRIRLHPESQ